MINTDKTPPQAVELEEAVLGAIMLEKDILDVIFEILKVESFYKIPNGIIYKACLNVHKRNEPIDILTVTQELKRTGQLDNVGGAYYITQLTNRVASAANAEFHARIVAQKYIQREVIRITSESLVKAYEANTDVFDLLDGLSFALTAINNSFFFGKQIKTREVIDNTAAAVQKAKDNNGVLGPSTGLDDLDKILCGLRTPDVMVIAGRPAMGKEQPLSAKILTPNGWKTMGDMEVGMQICGSNGNNYNVTGVFPQGMKDVYEVCFDDGTKTRCGIDHLWEVEIRKNRKEGIKKHLVMSLKDIIDSSIILSNNRKNFTVRHTAPIEFSEKNLPIHPYLMGIYLAEGNSGECVTISNPEDEIFKNICEHIPSGDYVKRIKGNLGARINGRNMFRHLNDLGLHKKNSHEKFIPKDYLFGSQHDRLLLLQGLLDGDGHIATPNCIEYSTTSEQLKLDVMDLVRSLGGRVDYISRMGRYKKDGIYKETRINYRIYISFDSTITPVSTQKHLLKYKNQKQFHHKFITSVTKLSYQELSQCIMVNSPDHCYITDDYIVTHNTAAVLCIAKALAIAQNLPVQIFSLEMSSQQLMLRLLSDLAEIDNRVLSTGKLSVTEQSAFEAAQRNIPDHLYIDDSPAITIQYFESVVRKKVLQGVKYFIIDYLQLMRLTEKDAKGKNREQQIAFLTGEIKRIAKKYDIWICELSQISRDCEDRDPPRPMLSDLRESGAIEQDADIVMFLYRPEYYNIEFIKSGRSSRRVAELIISKHRNGPVDSVITKFIGEYTRFENDEPKKTDSMDDVEKTPELVF